MNMKRYTRFAARSLVLIALLSAGIAVHGQNRSTISGIVFDDQRRPIVDLYVELLNEVNSTLGRTRTDSGGRYFFGGLSQGRFQVRVLTHGTPFEGSTADVEIAGIGMTGRQLADNVQKDFYLTRRKGSDTIPFVNAVVFAQEIPADAENAFKSALKALDDENQDVGLKELERAVSIFPDYFAALQKLGIIYISKQDYKKARDAFARASDVNRSSFDSLYGLGYAYSALGETDKAIEACERSAVLKPASVEVNLLLGMSYRKVKKLKKAEEVLLRAKESALEPSADVHWQLALLYGRDSDRYAEAAKELELYLKARPDAENKELIKKLIKDFERKAK